MISALFCLALTINADPKVSSIFEENKAELTEKQKGFLKNVKENKMTVSSLVVKLAGQDALKGKLGFKLPGGEVVVEDYKLRDEKGTKFLSWGKAEGDELGTLAMSKNACYGMIFHNKKVYWVVPLGDGIAVVSEVDQTKAPPDKQPLEKK